MQGNNDVLSMIAHPHIKVFSGNPDAIQALSGPFTPAQMKKAYGIDQITFGMVTGDGTGQTVAIVDAYTYTNAASDFVAFCNHYSLPTTGLTVMTQQDLLNDSSGTPITDEGWNLEAALDIQSVRALAPGANIVLIQARSSDTADLFACVQGAAALAGVCAVSMSWGSDTFSNESDYDYVFITPNGHQGVTFCASTGDNGEPGGYPADSPNVIAVGGTTLTTDGSGNWSSEAGWSGSGGSISPYENKPSYQHFVTQSSTKRCQPDVAFDADPSTGVLVYCNSGSYSGWVQVGGTSLACPCWAALIAIANQGRAINGLPTLDGFKQTLPILYGMTLSNNFHDITTGNNGFAASSGYDLVTGRGSPKANNLIVYLSIANISANGTSTVNGVSNLHHNGTFSITSTSTATGASSADLISTADMDATGISSTNFATNSAIGISKTVTVLAVTASFTDNTPQNFGTPITFTDTSSGATSWAWDFGDSSGTSTSQNPTYTYGSSGTYTVTLSVNDNLTSASNSVVVNATLIPIWQKIDLSSYFNVIGILPVENAGEPNSGLDGDNPGTGYNGFNEDVLSSLYPNPIVVDNVHFNIDYNNEMNTIFCGGQIISLSGGCFDYIYMLGTGVNGGTSGEYASFVVTYSDTTTTTVNVQFSDWFYNSNNYANETMALGGSENLNRTDLDGPVFIFKYTLAIDRTKNAVSLTLPINQKLMIFAISEASNVTQMGMWVTADYLQDTGSVDGDPITTWTDISGGSHHAGQSNSGLKPTFHTNVVNGYPALRFTASGLSGNAYTAGKYLTSNVFATEEYSVIAVVRQSNPTGKFNVAVSWGGNSGAKFWTGYIPDDSPTAYPGHFIPASDSANDIYSAPVDDTNWHISEGIFNGTHLSGWNSSIVATGAGVGASGNHNGSSTALIGTLVTIGCYHDINLFWNGDVAEVMLFPVALSDSDRAVIESYLIYKYNLQTQNEIQRITLSPAPNGGTFTITVNGQTTGSISSTVGPSDVQTAINTALGAENTSVT